MDTPDQPTPIADNSLGVTPPSSVPSAGGGEGAVPPPSPSPSTGLLAEIDDTELVRALIRRGKNPPSRIALTRKDEDDLVQQVLDDITNGNNAMGNFVDNITELWGNWRGVKTDKNFPFENCSNIRVPLTSVFVETMTMRLLKAIVGGDLICKLNYVNRQVDAEQLDEANHWFKWELKHNVKFRSWLINALREMLITGLNITIPSYVHEKRYLHSQRAFALPDGLGIKDACEQALETIINQPSDWGTPEKLAIIKQTRPGDFKLNDGGRIVLSLKPLDDPEALDGQPSTTGEAGELIADIWRREVTFDGVKLNSIALEDLCVPNTHQSIDDLPFFACRMWLDTNQYRTCLDNKFFMDLGEEENKRIMVGAYTKQGETLDHPLTDLQDSEEGYDSTGDATQASPAEQFIEIYRDERWWAWGGGAGPGDLSAHNDDFIDRLVQPATQVAVWVAVQARRIIRIARLEDINKNGKRSGVKLGFIEEPGRFFPMGLAEWVRHCQAELDAIHNQRLDAGLLFNVPWGLYKPAAGMSKTAQPINIQPGKLFPVADPQGVNLPRNNWVPSFSFAEEQLVYKYATDQAGLSEAAMGRANSKRQSASEFVGIASAIELRTEGVLESLLENIQELLFRVLGLYQQYGPRERIFRVGGEGGVEVTKRFERDRLQGQLTLEMAGDVAQINEQIQRQTAVDMIQLLLNQFLIQLGITGPDTIYAAVKTLCKLQHYDVPLHKPQAPPMSDAPEVEEQQMFAGTKPIGPTIGENTHEHLAHHSMTSADSRLMESWTPEARELLAEHIRNTMQVANAQQVIANQRNMLATQMAGQMAEKGINPGKAGDSRPNANLGPGGQQEGVQGGNPSDTSPAVAQAA